MINRRWLRRLFYAAVLFVWLFVLTVPLFAVLLALRGELAWERGLVRDRVFIVQEQRQRGIGWEAVRRIDAGPGATIYVATDVRYFLWEGEAAGLNARFVECYETAADGALTYIGACVAP